MSNQKNSTPSVKFWRSMGVEYLVESGAVPEIFRPAYIGVQFRPFETPLILIVDFPSRIIGRGKTSVSLVTGSLSYEGILIV